MSTEDGDLRDVWCSAARRATDAQLVACVAAAMVAAVAFGIGALVDVRAAFRWWPLVLPALLAGAFGVWGIADRQIAEESTTSASRRALEAVKWCAAAGGGVVGALAAVGVLRITIGTWIS
jgi:hypothetical protein